MGSLGHDWGVNVRWQIKGAEQCSTCGGVTAAEVVVAAVLLAALVAEARATAAICADLRACSIDMVPCFGPLLEI